MCVGELIKAIARRLLHQPVMRFVDDYFAAEHEECAKHSMLIFARCSVWPPLCLFVSMPHVLQAGKSIAGQ